MNLIDRLKVRAAEYAATDLSKKAAKGELGGFAQRAYRATLGYKTTIGLALFLITQALGTFTPPGADDYIRYLSIAFGVLAAIGAVDKARRNQPIWEPWFLEAMAAASAWIFAASAAVLGFTQSGLLDLIFPGDLALVDTVTLVCTALTTATAFINRLAKASAAEPK